MTDEQTTPPPADVREDVRSTIAVALRWQQAEDEAYGPSLSVTKADAIIAALTEAGYAITKAEAGIVSIERRAIEYDKGYDAFKQFVLEQIPDWEPGDWQVMAEAVWTAIDAATPAQAGATLRYTDADMNAVYKAIQELALQQGMRYQWFFDAMDNALIKRIPPIAVATPDPDEGHDDETGYSSEHPIPTDAERDEVHRYLREKYAPDAATPDPDEEKRNA